MNKFIFRVESDNKAGMGHFYRCLALANILDGYQKTFLMNDFQPHLAGILNSSNIKLKTLNSDRPFNAIVDELSAYIDKKDIVILDGYQYDQSYMAVLSNLAAGLVVIDDLNKGKYFADIILNHGPHAENVKYKSPNKTKLLLGRQYTLLRPAFYRNAGKGEVRDQVKVITICFGGADSKGFASKYLEALTQMGKIFQVNIILGASNHNPNSEYEKFNQNLIKVIVYRNVIDEKMASLLLESDLLIATPSNIMMEACTLNIPTITQSVAKNQDPFYDFLDQHKLATCIPECSENSTRGLAELLNKTIFDKAYRKKMVGNQKKIFDGKSKLRLRNEFETLAENCGISKNINDKL
jgi:UDP-2,4-diacetamido-2,4,6-trideoxy-beta-L-altropyranose hydrolase